jgi:hypothetical protein
MKIATRPTAALWISALICTAGFSQEGISEQEAAEIGVSAYIYGYPLVTIEMTRRVMTNVAAIEGSRGPMGHFVNLKEYPTAAFRDVTAPNADTLYSSAWLNVGQEPYVLSIPDEGDRYYLMPMLDAWTNVFQVPGKRTTGGKAQKYLITGPGWSGEVPEGMAEFKSPTSLVWIIGRTYCTGTRQDYEAVHAIQSQYSVVPLSAYGKPYTPPQGTVDPSIDMKTAVRDQVNRLDAATFFQTLVSLMKDNPPAKADAPILERMARIGMVPGRDFDLRKLDPAVARSLQGVPKIAQEKIMAHFPRAGVNKNGWTYTTNAGTYGTDYLQRALVAAIGLGANLPQDAIYPTSEVDSEGKPYDGTSRYVMHFPKGQTPPVKGFWSLTMYNGQYFFVENRINRYTVSSRSDFQCNDDGSLDIYIQNESPGKGKEPNWLPAPSGKFILMLRLYWPQETSPSIIDGTWTPPAVTRAGK